MTDALLGILSRDSTSDKYSLGFQYNASEVPPGVDATNAHMPPLETNGELADLHRPMPLDKPTPKTGIDAGDLAAALMAAMGSSPPRA